MAILLQSSGLPFSGEKLDSVPLLRYRDKDEETVCTMTVSCKQHTLEGRLARVPL